MSDLLTRLRDETRDRFVIEREIGRGGMGAVFLARELALDRPVAIKVLPPELAAQTSMRERFLREARAAAGFSHPNVVPVHAVHEAGELLLFVMGYIEGESLAQRVNRAGPLAPQDLTRLMQELAWALSYAHGRGVVHRDIKPDNVLIERTTGRALVTDFGIARSASPGTGITMLGEVVGTPEYMSPEQASGETIDGRSDLYSLGCTMYYAATGEPPHRGENIQATLAMHLTREPRPLAPRRPDMPAALVEAIERCLAKDPSTRPASGEALADALEPLRASQPDVAPPIRVFYQRAGQAVRATLIILPVGAFLVSRLLPASDADAAVLALAMVAGLAGLWRGILSSARSLLQRGFRFEDVRDGVRAILQERVAERDFALAQPGARERRRRRIMAQAGMILAALLLHRIVMIYLRTEIAPGRHTVGVVGLIVAVVGGVLFAAGLVGLITEPTRIRGMDRFLTRLWSGRFGAWIFTLAAWRSRRIATAPSEPTRSAPTPLDTFETLPKEVRSQLTGVRDTIEQLEARVAALRDREQQLLLAVEEARAGTAGTTTLPGSESRREGLVADLTRALESARSEAALLEETLENVRLHLIRLRSGVGTPEELHEELSRATV